jgi:hypothetical protein
MVLDLIETFRQDLYNFYILKNWLTNKTMSHSVASKASNASSRMLEELASKSQSKYRFILIEGFFDLKEFSMTNK